jgi:hypoxanthine-DNA glycosylase
MKNSSGGADHGLPSRGFPPILGKSPRVLILGTLPSRASIARHEYYGHPRNAFWPIMAELFGATGDYAQRCEVLRNSGVAVWDVLAQSVRPGSLDANIHSQTARPNEIAELVNANDSLDLVCFNGRKARQLFDRFIGVEAVADRVAFSDLPSTSPAYAAMPLSEKTRAWRSALGARLAGPGHD